MMCRINLIRDRVLPPERRKALFAAISLWLAASSILLVFLVLRGTRDLRRLADAELEGAKSLCDESLRLRRECFGLAVTE